MMRGTFANIRIKNEMLDGLKAAIPLGPDGSQTSIYDAAMAYQAARHAIGDLWWRTIWRRLSAGTGRPKARAFGGQSRHRESFERIHRSNLVGMGVIPFEFTAGTPARALGSTAMRRLNLCDLERVKPLQEVPCTITMADGSVESITLKCRIDTRSRD